MKNFNPALIVVVLTALFGCSQYSDREIENKAMRIADKFDRSSVNVFKDWNYYSRGLGIWSKLTNQTIHNSAILILGKDTAELRIEKPAFFVKDFPINFSFDTNMYGGYSFLKTQNLVSIKALDSSKAYHALVDKVSLDSLFVKENPFEKVQELESMVSGLGILRISFDAEVGDFIEFYISSKYVLTYLPENARINQQKDYWLREFAKGKTIKKNWNLRKLDKPIDNG